MTRNLEIEKNSGVINNNGNNNGNGNPCGGDEICVLTSPDVNCPHPTCETARKWNKEVFVPNWKKIHNSED